MAPVCLVLSMNSLQTSLGHKLSRVECSRDIQVNPVRTGLVQYSADNGASTLLVQQLSIHKRPLRVRKETYCTLVERTDVLGCKNGPF